MRTDILKKYETCARFDEGEYCRSREYREISVKEEILRKLMTEMFGVKCWSLVEEYIALIYDEMELEAQHFFEQGYLMKRC